MTSLLISNHNAYTSTHEAFKLANLAKWADSFGVEVFVRCFDDTPKLDHPKLHYTDAQDDETIIRDLENVLTRLRPEKIVNLVEGYFPWNMIDSNAELIYFVRSCAAKTLDVITHTREHTFGWMDAVEAYTVRAEREARYLKHSDRVVTDSPNSEIVIRQYYGIHADVCLEYIDPDLYRLPRPIDSRHVYNVGRTDYIKGLHWVSASPYHSVTIIGDRELGAYSCIASHMRPYSWLPREQYVDLIRDCVFGIFPALWESNGYAVQECLAMGKIPVIQEGSGGNQRLATPSNSVIVDFGYGHGDWWSCLRNLDIERMSECARDTLTHKMYLDSLERFGNVIC